jgi:hypothetical protein
MEKARGFIGRLIISVVVWIVVAIIVWLVGAAFAALFPGILPLANFGGFLKTYAGLIGFVSGIIYFFFGSKA